MKREWRKLIRIFKEQQILAKELGVVPCSISIWANGHKLIPIHHAIKIEQLTKGKITREMLRPDIFVKIQNYEEKDDAE